jgi:hypothetical protein
VAEALSAEEVLKREISRFQARFERANTEAQEAQAQVEKLEQALAVLQGQDSQPKE